MNTPLEEGIYINSCGTLKIYFDNGTWKFCSTEMGEEKVWREEPIDGACTARFWAEFYKMEKVTPNQ